jgi:alpha-ketoglutarate-dependent taurine dioxygenase
MRIGNLRDTFYGRTWDVKSVPEAKNVAYTAQYLGLHMDLLYMADPPGFQFLHCLQNSCEGGSSLFSDAFYAASRLSPDAFYNLSRMTVAYHYRNAGEHYYFRHPIIDVPVTALETLNRHSWSERINFINYSPPFQANHVATGQAQQSSFPALLDSMRKFASLVEDEKNLYQYRLQEGECVIFNNRRVLHGRRQFDTSAGSRWLKGAYIDTDVFMSKYRVLSEKFAGSGLEHLSFEGKRLVSPPDAA